MKKIHSLLWKTGFAALLATCALPAGAQSVLPAGTSPMIVTPHEQTVSYRERTLCYDIMANVDFEISVDQDWVTVRKGTDGTVYVHLAQNLIGESRTARITFSNADNNITEVLTLTQGPDGTISEVPEDLQIRPSVAKDNNHQSGMDISLTYDKNTSTYYHTSWGNNPFDVSETNPAVLEYNFTDVEKIDYITYIPRQDGNSNGNFGKVKLYIKKVGETAYTLHGEYDWKESSSPRTIEFEGGLLNPSAVKFEVLSGAGNYASCAEMQFCVKTTATDEYGVFADDIYSQLRPEITEGDIEKLTNPFVKALATQIYNKTYDTNYRVASYPCFISYMTLSQLWNAPGKYYDQLQGVTGINISKGKHVVMVSGIPQGVDVSLKVVAWFSKELNEKGDGAGPATYTYGLRNGMNVINYDSSFDGLAYICYYVDESPENYPDIKVHFINGQVNGYLSPDKTNEEMYEICKNAKNVCMDVYGKKVHSVWTAAGLRDYCKASDNRSLGYRQYMNVLDSLIQWEHRLLGFEKYGRVPKNRTMAYVNYTYYMFQGGYGVSFKYDTERRVLNCRTLMYNDDDAIWGLSHEWGHQHQMQPYFCWAGMSEVTNNMNSYYNIMQMGYTRSDKINSWPVGRRHFIENGSAFTPTCDNKFPYYQRHKAYENRNLYTYSQELYDMCEAMKDSVPPAANDDPARAIGITEAGVGEILCPFIMLYNYATEIKGLKDFGPDLYEALRQTDDENGSQIEKKGAVDKYELIASAQNENKNNKLAVLDQKFPESCWAPRSGNNYITMQHCGRFENSAPYIFNFVRKTSRLLGYNLFPYFDRWGFMRQIALRVGDYGDKNIIITKKMYDEFKADMDALVESGELKAMPEGMVEEISNTKDLFEIWGHAAGSATTPPNIPN